MQGLESILTEADISLCVCFLFVDCRSTAYTVMCSPLLNLSLKSSCHKTVLSGRTLSKVNVLNGRPPPLSTRSDVSSKFERSQDPKPQTLI